MLNIKTIRTINIVMQNIITQESGEYASHISAIEEIIADAKSGRMFILIDDEDRENEGDLVIPASFANAEAVNFMARFGRGLICLAMERQMIRKLGLTPMALHNTSRNKTAFTVSIEAKQGITTGISAADRARTIQVAIDDGTNPTDIATPGHIFPLEAREGGVLVRAGHTEAAVDISQLAGLKGAGVICEIMNDDGTMARLPQLVEFAKRHKLKIAKIADLIEYRSKKDKLIECIHRTTINSTYAGELTLRTYVNKIEYAEHIALIKGDVASAQKQGKPVLVRVHSSNILSDAIGSKDFGKNPLILQKSLQMIAEETCGVIVILRDNAKDCLSRLIKSSLRESNQSQSDKLEDKPDNTGDATGEEEGAEEAVMGAVMEVAKQDGDKEQQAIMKQQTPKQIKEKTLRTYGIGAQILQDIGIKKMKLISSNHVTNNIIGLQGYDIDIIENIIL